MTLPEAPPLRRMRAITTVVLIVAVAVTGGVQLVIASDPWWHAVLLAPSMIVAVWIASRWNNRPDTAVLTAALAVGGATWVAAVFVGSGPLSVLGLAVTGGVMVSKLPTRRPIASAVLIGAVAAVGLLRLTIRPDEAAAYVLAAVTYTVLFIGVLWLNDTAWRLFTELDTTRRTETELAIMKERVRFASDLHDIQGHTLHVIKLKAAVAARFQHTDPARTADELAEIERLTSETIDQARELANATRKLSFTTELSNATELLDAAGTRVAVDGSDAGHVADDAIFALVLREATTNILRHTRATTVTIHVGAECSADPQRRRTRRARPAAGAGLSASARQRRRRRPRPPPPGRHVHAPPPLRPGDDMTTVVLADDEGLIRSALAALLPVEGDIHVLAEAAGGDEALTAFATHTPDVLVLDLEMPAPDGLDVAGRILAEHPEQAILILTRHARPGTLRSALRLGVRGFISKHAAPALIAEAISEVATGGRHIDPTVSAQALIDDCPLTEREKDVLRVASDGYSVRDIARILHLAPGTVRNYLSAAISKTHTSTRHDAARHAREHGWL